MIDTHCHLDWFAVRGMLERIVEESRRAGVTGWVVPGVDPAGWELISQITERIPGAYAAFGLHPMHASKWDGRRRDDLEQLVPRSVAVGEIGIDTTAGYPSRAEQEKAFREQLEVAAASTLPVIVHCRKAFAETIRIIDETVGDRLVGGVVHAFSGSMEIAREFVRRGFLVGIAGSITWGNARRLPSLVSTWGVEHLLMETDAPDLSPEPFRGTINSPANLPLIVTAVARLSGVSEEVVREVTLRNARTLFLSKRELPCHSIDSPEPNV